MNLQEIHSFPSETPNVQMYEMFMNTVTDDDITRGTNPVLFGLAQLIEWAIINKKFTEYYSHVNKLSEKDRAVETERLVNSLDVIVVFNVACEPTFGFLREDDGDDVIMFPGKHSKMHRYL